MFWPFGDSNSHSLTRGLRPEWETKMWPSSWNIIIETPPLGLSEVCSSKSSLLSWISSSSLWWLMNGCLTFTAVCFPHRAHCILMFTNERVGTENIMCGEMWLMENITCRASGKQDPSQHITLKRCYRSDVFSNILILQPVMQMLFSDFLRMIIFSMISSLLLTEKS